MMFGVPYPHMVDKDLYLKNPLIHKKRILNAVKGKINKNEKLFVVALDDFFDDSGTFDAPQFEQNLESPISFPHLLQKLIITSVF